MPVGIGKDLVVVGAATQRYLPGLDAPASRRLRGQVAVIVDGQYELHGSGALSLTWSGPEAGRSGRCRPWRYPGPGAAAGPVVPRESLLPRAGRTFPGRRRTPPAPSASPRGEPVQSRKGRR